jgi:hypothetical protein
MKNLILPSLFTSMAVLAAGCGAPPPDDLEVVGAELRVGDFSFADPAVGQSYVVFGNQGVGPCTATLIDPAAVVTAAHCVRYFTGNLPGTFYIDVSSTQEVNYPIIAVRSFGSSGGNDDVAVIRLGQPVPASVAVPLRIQSGAIIAMGERFTMYGYGCRAHEPDAYSGHKQRYDGRYDHVVYGCPGDSGGPLIKTFPSGLRAISKVISGSHRAWWWSDPVPTYGLVYRHAYTIANQVDDWAGRPRGSYGVDPPRGGGGRGPDDPPILPQ